MPDAVMMLAYPAAKPLDTKGYITRLYVAADTVVTLVPSAVTNAVETTTASGRGDPAPKADASDLGRRDASAPTTTTVATESPMATTRGV
jgi:hypothetical protein